MASLRCAFVFVCVHAYAVSGQVSGTVVDASGRPLPFVTVTTASGEPYADSAWRAPSIRTLTDLRGRFVVPDTMIPHDTLWIAALGYQTVRRAVQPGDTVVQVLYRGTTAHQMVARVGLAERPDVVLRDKRSGWMVSETVVVGRQYELIISTSGTSCGEFGSTMMERMGSGTLIAVSVLSGEEVCTLKFVERQMVLPISFDQPGMTEVRVVGRWNDVSLQLQVRR